MTVDEEIREYALLVTKYAFFAGLIEGDGSVMLRAHKDPRKHFGVCFGMFIAVSNTKKELLDFLKQSFGGRISGWQPKVKGRSFMHKWELGGEKAAFILEQIYPYLITKKPQAKLAIKMQGILSIARRGGSAPSTQEEYEEKVQMVKEMHKLNAKGNDKQWLKL